VRSVRSVRSVRRSARGASAARPRRGTAGGAGADPLPRHPRGAASRPVSTLEATVQALAMVEGWRGRRSMRRRYSMRSVDGVAARQ